MLLPLVATLVWCVLSQSDLEWHHHQYPQPHRGNHTKADPQLLRSRGYLSVSKYYSQTSQLANSDKIRIYVERHQHLHVVPKSHLIMLAGGPGQKSTVWKDELPYFAKLAGPQTAFYVLDHRGLGKSAPFCSDLDDNWQHRGTYLNDDPRYISTTNAAHDVARLAVAIRRQSNGPVRLALLGVSYGGLWAARVVTIYPRLFDWLLLDSPSQVRGRFSSRNDGAFWKNCLRSGTCQRLIGSKRRARKIYKSLLQGKRRNRCTRQLKGKMEAILRPALRGIEVSERGNVHSSMLAVPFMLHAYKCRHPHIFKRQILPQMRQLAIKSELSVEGLNNHFGLNDFANAYLCVGELYDYSGTKPRQCKHGPKSLTDQCTNYRQYRQAYRRLRHRMYKRDKHHENHINTDKTRIVVLLGGMDLVTPPLSTHKWLKHVSAPQLLTLTFDKLGHGIAPFAPCLSHLFNYISGDSIALKHLQKCIRKENRRKLDWRFSKELRFARRWVSLLER